MSYIHNTVYKITNKVNKKFYIGVHQTNNVDDGYMGSGVTLSKAISKYGIENFEKEIIFDCDNSNDMFRMEKLIVGNITINQPDCYNESPGGKGGSKKGRKMPKGAIEKIRESLIGRPSHRKGKTGVYTEQTLQRMSRSQKGRKHSIETKKKISQSNQGITRGKGVSKSKEHVENMRKAKLGSTHSNETKQKMSEIAKGRVDLLEHTRYMRSKSSGTLGYRHTDASKKKMSIARKKWWENKENNV